MKKSFYICLVSFLLCIVIVGCSKKDPIVGEWAYGSGSVFVYVFNDDNTCSYAGKNCTYAVDGNKLSILYEGNTVPFETTFRIEDNKLIIKDSFDNDVEYTRK